MCSFEKGFCLIKNFLWLGSCSCQTGSNSWCLARREGNWRWKNVDTALLRASWWWGAEQTGCRLLNSPQCFLSPFSFSNLGPRKLFFWFESVLDRMQAYINACLCWGLLFRLMIAAGAIECTEKEVPEIKPKPSTMKLPTECLIECSSMTYINKLQLQDDHNIRITDSTEGKFYLIWSVYVLIQF